MAGIEAVAWLRRAVMDDKVLAGQAWAYRDEVARSDANLALLDVHAPVEDGDRLTCRVCVTWEDDEGEYEFGIALPVPWPCLTLHLLASAYRHRDGYAGHWATGGSEEASPGPLDLVHRHPDIPVNIPLRNKTIRVYDMVLPPQPQGEMWTPFRNVFPRWHSGKACYTLPSGNRVHVKPGCRCRKVPGS